MPHLASAPAFRDGLAKLSDLTVILSGGRLRPQPKDLDALALAAWPVGEASRSPSLRSGQALDRARDDVGLNVRSFTKQLLRSGIALVALLTAAGCDAGLSADCIAGTEPACPPPAQDEVVAGVNLTALFAAPTDAERDSVAARLARTGGTDVPRVVRAVATELAPDTDATRYVLLDLRDADDRAVAFALARVPAIDGGPATPLRTLFLLPDASGDASETDFLTARTSAETDLERRTVQITVAARGASLVARGGPYTSDVAADPYRADVVDLLALTGHLALVPRTDPTHLGVLGVGRGGAVALLAAERVPGLFRAVATLGAPTSLFDVSFQATTRDALHGRPTRLPGAAALLAPVFALRDGQISRAEARLRLLELSAIALPDRLPSLIAFHADPDGVVPTTHLVRLREQGNGTVDDPRHFEIIPEGVHDILLGNVGVRGLLAAFLGAEL